MGAGPRVAPELAAEFPGLRLRTAEATVDRSVLGRSPRELRDRLRALSDRYRGARAVELRREPIASAHRVFFRQVGIDPDVRRPPLEAAVLERLVRGGFVSERRLADALLVALVETGVAVWAVDGERVDGRELELGTDGAGAIVVADSRGVVAPLFAPPLRERRPRRETRVLVLYAVQVPGVSDLSVGEALWTCEELLGRAA